MPVIGLKLKYIKALSKEQQSWIRTTDLHSAWAVSLQEQQQMRQPKERDKLGWA